MFDRCNRNITYLRISVTDLCNLRCRYCMPEAGVTSVRHSDILSFEEIEAIVRTGVSMGITKVRLTGGEPLVRRDIVKLVDMLARVAGVADFAMTTNGILLADLAEPLKQAGLHRLNVSLDTIDAKRFSHITRGGDVIATLAGLEAASRAGFKGTKINCVVTASPREPDARQVARYAERRGLEVRFIRRMDLASGQFWRVHGGEGGHCDLCNRLRVTSQGHVFPCLFYDVSFSIRELGIEQALRLAVAAKPESGKRSAHAFWAMGG